MRRRGKGRITLFSPISFTHSIHTISLSFLSDDAGAGTAVPCAGDLDAAMFQLTALLRVDKRNNDPPW